MALTNLNDLSVILQRFDRKTIRELKRKAMVLFIRRINALGKSVQRRMNQATGNQSNKPVFGAKVNRNKTDGYIYGSYQNPAVVSALFMELPSTDRRATVPHPVQIESDQWVYARTNQRVLYHLTPINPALRVTLTDGYDAPDERLYFYRSPRTNQIFAADKRFPHTTHYVEVNYGGTDLFSDQYDLDQIALDVWDTVINEME